METIRLYLAILNKGWIRREVAHRLIPQMARMGNVEVTWEQPSKSWGEPICSARNEIRKRFLEHRPKQDFCMMMDEDIVPYHNPAELVFADKDIVGCPTKVRQSGGELNWVAYMEHPTLEGYAPVDFGSVDDQIDLLKVDAVGTGCVIIKRNVLEALKFQDSFDSDGIRDGGSDLLFCKEAKKHNFKIYTTPWRICDHIKQLGLIEMQGYDDSDNRDYIADKFGFPWGYYSILQKDWKFIKEILTEEKIKTVLEFGSGLSSLLMSELCKVMAYETDEKHMVEVSNRANDNLTLKHWDGHGCNITKRFDLCFVDGPSGEDKGGAGREGSIRIASEVTDRIIIHDAGRTDEQRWQNKFLRGKFRLAKRNGWHVQRCHYWVRRT